MSRIAALLSAGLLIIVIAAVWPLAARHQQDRSVPSSASDRISYPPAPKGIVVDDYHGTKVPDPYRWLEEADAPDTARWVEAQNALTRSILDGSRREELRAALEKAYDFPRVSVPVARGGRYFFTRNAGLQNQAVLYVQEGLAGAPRVLLDPNTLSPDGTVALTQTSVNHDGTLLGYAISRSGSDRQEILVREVATGRDRPDRVQWAKFTNITWTRDAQGFFYTRFPKPGDVPAGDENYFSRVYVHKLGDPQEKDGLVMARPSDREVVFSTESSSDGRYLVITANRGSSDDSESYVMDLQNPDVPRALFTGFDAAYHFADAAGTRLFFRTTLQAPLARVIAVDMATLGEAEAFQHGPAVPLHVPFSEVVPQGPDTLSGVALGGGRLVLTYQHDANDRLRVFTYDGTPDGDIALPTMGSLMGLWAEPDQQELFYRFTSYTYVPTTFRYDFRTKASAPFGDVSQAIDPGRYETRQVWYPSKDGTKVSMFVVHRKGLPLDGARPTYLTAYGGFNISLTPAFDPSFLPWLEAGGVLAVPNLRGGGEYGDRWHRAGMFEKKQNVFDDFIAAAEWLIANKYTRPGTLAIEGGSNGGLLVGAAEVQRPDLFGAVICRVPVADMLRYHRFTVGRFWISEYGSADDPQQFPYLFKYSPLHNVKDGVAYPPTLVMTADTDDRVAPGMAKKFAARLQEATRGGGPILIRVETKAGHGAGKPVSKQIEEDADVFAFLARYLAR